jgi:hypothetical protein
LWTIMGNSLTPCSGQERRPPGASRVTVWRLGAHVSLSLSARILLGSTSGGLGTTRRVGLAMFLKETRASFLQSLRPALMISCVTSVGLVPVARTLPSLHPAHFIFLAGKMVLIRSSSQNLETKRRSR